MKFVFLHPDLGIGGAERLVIDAALALKSNGHSVKFITSHQDPSHCFPEIKNREIPVSVHGSWFPRSFAGRFLALCAYIRMLLAALCFCIWETADIVFCDQIAACIPLLRILKPQIKVLFYCHFPDMLLTERKTLLKTLYRWPLDRLEEYSTGLADRVLVNSRFTAEVFGETFKSLKHIQLDVLYPTLNTAAFDTQVEDFEITWPKEREFIFLSINRFENKKNVALAVKSLAQLRTVVSEDIWLKTQLLICGGYDLRVTENQENFQHLQRLVETLAVDDHVTFFLSPSDSVKRFLLSRCTALLYTPSKEHFGIVPLEAMYCKKPVIAVKSGGPRETVQDGISGFLVAEGQNMSDAMKAVIENPQKTKVMGEKGRDVVSEEFSFNSFRTKLNNICITL